MGPSLFIEDLSKLQASGLFGRFYLKLPWKNRFGNYFHVAGKRGGF